MAIVDCPECGGVISSDAAQCPHCGKPYVAPPPPARPSVTVTSRRRPGCFVVSALLLVVAAAALVVLYSVESPYTACHRAHDVVLSRLRAPDTARFHSCLGSDRASPTATGWIASGVVEADDGSGHTQRLHYTVTLHYAGHGAWVTDGVQSGL